MQLSLVCGACPHGRSRRQSTRPSRGPSVRWPWLPTWPRGRTFSRKNGGARVEGGREFEVSYDDHGSGRSETGRNLDLKAPDMRQAGSRRLSDGALYDLIANPVRCTGMPGREGELTPAETWKLVAFIRKLPTRVGERRGLRRGHRRVGRRGHPPGPSVRAAPGARRRSCSARRGGYRTRPSRASGPWAATPSTRRRPPVRAIPRDAISRGGPARQAFRNP
jgi:hypothetical protein